MFSSLSAEEIRHAKASLSSNDPRKGKVFDLEVAKFLLLFASVVYERANTPTRERIKHAHKHSLLQRSKNAISSASEYVSSNGIRTRTSSSPPPTTRSSRPGAQALHSFGKNGLVDLRRMLDQGEGDSVIEELAKRLDVEYEPISELNSASSAYAAIFWDKRSNWVLLSFKGTSPAEFDEWLTDFDITRVPAGHSIPGYSQIHRGFKSRLFPEGPSSQRNPYETIMSSLKIVCNDLMTRTTKDINVYFTGHSLGCAIATLAYSRALLDLDGLSSRIQICDAYLFGAPVICDMISAKVFNDNLSRRPSDRVPTMWRVTNRMDAVCTLLPSMGDNPSFAYPTSIFAYAHLGSEVKMRPGSGTSILVDNYASDGSEARVVSRMEKSTGTKSKEWNIKKGMDPASIRANMKMANRNAIEVLGLDGGLPLWVSMMEYVPFIGRMVSHFPGLYFVSLQEMSDGPLVWKRVQKGN